MRVCGLRPIGYFHARLSSLLPGAGRRMLPMRPRVLCARRRPLLLFSERYPTRRLGLLSSTARRGLGEGEEDGLERVRSGDGRSLIQDREVSARSEAEAALTYECAGSIWC